MPDAKISELPAATAPTGAELVEIVQGGVNKQTTTQDIADLASGGVSSVFTRSGAVVAANGDYTATQVTNTPAGTIAATTVQAAINELDTEKSPIASPTFIGVPAAPTAAVGTNTTQVATTEFVNQNRVLGLAFSDELTPITATTDKLTFHWPYTTTFLEIWIELKTAQASGSIFTVDVHKAGTTILSTKLTIDNTEETSLTATTAAVISVAAVTKGDKMTIDVDQVGDGTAIGGKIWFRG